MKERGSYRISSTWKFKNLLVFIVLTIIFGTIIFSSAQLRGKVLEESKVYNTKAIEAMGKKVFVEKITKINKDIDIEANITTIQSGIVLGSLVYWKKNIKLSEPANLSIEIPSTATNISIVKLVIWNVTLNETETNITKTNETTLEEINITEETEINQTLNKTIPDVSKNINEETNVTVNETDIITDSDEIISEEIDKKVEEETKNKSKETLEIEIETSINKSEKKEIVLSITGNVILKNNIQKPLFGIFAWFQKIFRLTGLFLIEDSGEENIIVEIDEIVKEVEIEYETPTPYSIEEEQENKKFITIVGPENIHYENVLAFTELSKEVPENAVKLYWIVNETKVEIEITKYDLNNNSLIDYIEWIVPHLSNQSYELIIEISKAEHLDNNRTFVEDVYEGVKAKDNSWIKIPAQHYLRVTFNQNLTFDRDITIYAKSNGSAEIEVYRQNDSELITKFKNISNENWYKVYLNNLNESETNDVFDLRILNKDIEFDYVVDPASAYNISFVSPTPPNDTTTTNTSIEINVSITNAADLNEVIYNWDGTNYTMYNDSLVLMMNFDNVSALGENDTHVFDVSGYGNNGTFANNGSGINASLASGKYGSGINTTGSGEYIRIIDDDSLEGMNELTLAAWIKKQPNQPSGESMIIRKWVSYALEIMGGKPTIFVNGNYTSRTNLANQQSALNDNTWYHIVGIYNGSHIKMYVNGAQTGSEPSDSGNIFVDAYNLHIGSTGTGGQSGWSGFNGTIDEVRIWNRSLSADEIQQQYFSNLNKYDTDKWLLYVNEDYREPIGSVTYTYFASAEDTTGNENLTETRYLNVNAIIPQINFTSPTPDNGTTQSTTSVYVNVSTSDANEHSAFIDWNRNLVGWWKFDEYNATGIYDNSTYDNFGKFTGGLSTSDITTGKRGKALEFDGVNDYVGINNISLGTSDFTIDFWMKLKNPTSGAGRFVIGTTTSGKGFTSQQYAGTQLRFHDDTTGMNIGYNLGDTNWHHIVGMVNSSGSGLYVDGILRGADTDRASNWTVRFIGDDPVNPVLWNFEGTLDEVRIHKRALSPEEINASYQAGTYRLFKNFTDLSDGTYDYTAHVIDAAGNVNKTETREVSVDVPMVITIISPLNNSNYNTDTIDFNISLNDAGNWCGFSLNGTANVTMTKFSNTYFNYTKTGLNDADYNITFSCNDTWGNMTSSNLNFFLVDTINPDINFTLPTPPDDNITINNWVYVNVSTSDANEHSAFIDWNRSLVGWWRFDNSSDVSDHSTYGNDGTNYGSTYTLSGKRGGAREFDSVNDYIKIEDSNSLTGMDAITLSAWIKVKGAGSYQRIIAKRYTTSYSFYLYGSTSDYLGVALVTENDSVNIACSNIGTITWDKWHHVVVTWDSAIATYICYIDGKQQLSGSLTGIFIPNDIYDLTIGAVGAGSSPFNGTMDEAMIFSRALSPKEINASYQAGTYRLYKNFTDLSDGTYDYTAHVIDAGGNVNLTETREIIIDTIYPQINIIYPENTSYNVNVSELNYTYTETNPDSCWYSKDGGATNSTSVSMGNNFTGIVSVGGSNTWIVYCNDTSNNLNSSSITFSVNPLWYNSGYPFTNKSFRISEFINVSGNNFTLAGENYRFIGADSYYLADYATNHTYDDDGNEINGSRDAVIEILNEAHYLNINVIRTWAGMQGSDDSHWIINESGGHHNLFEIGIPGNYSEEMFASLDWVLYEASKRDIRLQLVLINNWNDYGGMRWYAQKSPTTDKTYEDIDDYADGNYWVFHDQFYTDENSRQYFRNYINYILNRNNTYSGILYKDDPAIFSWLLANEPRAKSDGTGRSLIQDWTTNMTAYIKSIDSNHLVGLGIEGWGYVETWGEGTDMIADHNNTGVDFATYAIHPDQWAYFGERSEHTGSSEDWVDEAVDTNAYVDWWTNDTGLSYNNRYEGGYVPAYTPALARGGYENWVVQNVKWANDLGMPVLLQEAGYYTNYSKSIKDRFYQQMIHNFYNEGGDGLMFWTLNHDNYYYSTDINGTMDDGYGFYLSDDAFLRNKSQSVIDAINFTKYDNNGGSWIKELNNYKYDFVLNIGLANNITIDNCSLYLNISNGTWSGYSIDQVNSSPITYNNDYTFIKQFDDNVEEFYWYTQCCGDSSCINSTPAYVQVKIMTPSISLVSPSNNTFHNTNTLDLIYNVTNNVDGVFLDISYCELYINNNLNKTDYTISRGVDQNFSINFPNASYNWYIQCTDIDDNIGTSEIKIFTIDTTYPALEFVNPTPDNATSQSSTSVYVNVSTNDTNEHSAFIDWNRSLVGWWAMDFYNSTGIYDNSTYSNFGSFNGGLGTSDIVSGKRGKALEFDAVDDFVQVPDDNDLDFGVGNFSISFWMYPFSTDSNWKVLISKGYNSAPTIDSYYLGGTIRFFVRGVGETGQPVAVSSSIDTNKWSYITLVRTGSTHSIYLNGNLDVTANNNGNSTNNNFPLYIGGGYLNTFKGSIDEVLIFNRALSPEEINASYNAGSYRLYKNFTDLSDGTYDYTAHVIDAAGNVNKTEMREVTIDATTLLEFVNPTPANATSQSSTSVYVNVSTSDANEHSAFIDWNRSLVGWWSFENVLSNGTVYDNSSYGNDGVMGGFSSNTTVSGKRGKALEFDGVDDYVDVGNDSSLDFTNGEFTVEGWAKINNYPQANNYFIYRYTYYINFRSSGQILVRLRNSTGVMNNYYFGSVSTGNFNHYALIVKDESVKFYENGVSILDDTLPGGLEDNPYLSRVGIGVNAPGTGTWNFNGSIDEVMIFNRALTPEEINASYNAGLYRLYNNFTNLSDGAYDYTAHVIDAAGNVNQTETRQVTIDTSVSRGPSGGGGGGEVLIPELSELKPVPESFNIPATVGITGSGKISLLNSGDSDLDIRISLLNLQGIIQFDKTSLFLTAGQTEILEFKIIPPKEPGIYTGKIIFTAQGKQIEVSLALNVNSEISLFDISVDISDKYKSIDIGEKLISQITLIQAGLQEKADVTMAYVIKDFDGNSYLEETETIMVFKQKSYEHEFQTQDLAPGDYLIGAEVIYSGGVATASHQFRIQEKKTYSLIGLLIAVIAVLGVLVLIAKNYKKMRMLQSRKR